VRIPRILAAVALTALLSTTAACGKDDAGKPALPQAASADQPGSDPSEGTKVDPEDAMLDYTKCMREHGVDMPDPGADGGTMIDLGEVDMATMKAADKACGDILKSVQQTAPSNNMDDGKFEEMLLAQAKCLRSKGYDVPDPVAQGGGGFSGGVYPDNAHGPAFDKAMKECNDEVGLGGMQSFSSSSGVESK